MHPAERPDSEDAPRALLAAVVLVAIASGALLALRGGGDALLFGDEFHSLRQLGRSYGDLITSYGKNGAGGALALLQRASTDLFGPSLLAFRLPAVAGAIATLLLMYPAAARLVGRTPAAVATLALALNSVHVYYSRFGRAVALAVFLGLLLVFALTRAIEREGPRPVWYALAAVAAGLLPWVQLAAGMFAVSVLLAAGATLSLREASGRHAPWLLGTCAAALALCVGLHLPAWDSLWQFIDFESGRSARSDLLSIDSAALLLGSRSAGLVALAGAPASAAWLVTRAGSRALVPVAAAFAMPAGLLLAQPAGGVYDSASYLIVGLPFLSMLLAWGVAQIARAVGLRGRVCGSASLFLGALAVAACLAAGPLSPARVDEGPFAASALRLMPLPAFDEPWAGAPTFYDQLAEAEEPLRIVESPVLEDQATALYRNYYLRHRKPVSLAAVTEEFPIVSDGAYHLLDEVDGDDADYLILHTDVARELERYWDHVYRERWRPGEAPDRAAFMRAFESFSVLPPPPLARLVLKLRSRLGKPFYQDADIVVWKLGPRPGSEPTAATGRSGSG